MLLEFSRDTVMKAVLANRDAHQSALTEMVDGWRGELVDTAVEEIGRLQAIIDAGKAGTLQVEDVERYILGVSPPSSHLMDYDVAVGMLELATADVVALSEQDFARYMLDHWDWRGEFDDHVAKARAKQRRRNRR